MKVIGGSETPYEPLPRLRVFRWDIANRPQFIPDENPNDPRNIGQGFIGGFYNKKSKEYVFNFSGYIQDLISGKTKNYGTFITTNDFTSSRSILNQSARSIIGGGSNTTYRAKLRIYYTNLK